MGNTYARINAACIVYRAAHWFCIRSFVFLPISPSGSLMLCESYTRPISTNPGSMEAGEFGLTHTFPTFSSTHDALPYSQLPAATYTLHRPHLQCLCPPPTMSSTAIMDASRLARLRAARAGGPSTQSGVLDPSLADSQFAQEYNCFSCGGDGNDFSPGHNEKLGGPR